MSAGTLFRVTAGMAASDGSAMLKRKVWAVVGNHHARELFWVPLFQRAYWAEMWGMAKWYAFVAARPGRRRRVEGGGRERTDTGQNRFFLRAPRMRGARKKEPV